MHTPPNDPANAQSPSSPAPAPPPPNLLPPAPLSATQPPPPSGDVTTAKRRQSKVKTVLIGLGALALLAAIVAFAIEYEKETDIEDVAVGECFNEGMGSDFDRVKVVPCTELHNYEMFGVWSPEENNSVGFGDEKRAYIRARCSELEQDYITNWDAMPADLATASVSELIVTKSDVVNCLYESRIGMTESLRP